MHSTNRVNPFLMTPLIPVGGNGILVCINIESRAHYKQG
jgi:hypothetical protein